MTTLNAHVDRMTQTPFGQPRLDDYGQDSLVRYHDEHQEAHMSTITAAPVGQMTQVAVHLDLDAPANRRTSIYDPREPDLIDDDTAFWIGSEHVVGVALDEIRWFRLLVESRGMAPQLATMKGGHWVVHSLTDETMREGSLDDLDIAARTCR